MAQINLALFSFKELQDLLASWGEKPFRARQIYRWIWKEGVQNFDEMTNVSLPLRQRLKEECALKFPKIVREEKSEDGTIKYLLLLDDLKTVEVVWIPRADQERVTLCISTQVGCRMGCTFCLTAQQKVERNLTAGEIASQVRIIPNREVVTNVVVMGMGEPFDNYDSLMGGLSIITDPEALGIGPRKVTVSTSGLVPAIKKFVQESKCGLAISLNASNDEVRSSIMPINRAYNIEKLLGAVREVSSSGYPRAAGKNFSVTFEYILIRGLNDRAEHARELVKLLRGLPCKVNLLLYNENPNIDLKRPLEKDVETFRAVLTRAGLLNFVRTSRGRDISAACGQLASLHKRQQNAASTTATL